MNEGYKHLIVNKKLINDLDIDSYLTSLDFEICNSVEQWYTKCAPTAKIIREIEPFEMYLNISWYIEFETKEDLTLYILSKQD